MRVIRSMRYETAKDLSQGDFKRTYGVYPQIFEVMVKVAKVERMLKKKTGRNDKLIIEDQVLMTLAYWREYRTYFQQLDWVCWGSPSTPLVHLAQNWGINESTAYRIIRRTEDILIKSGVFALPGKKVLIKPETEIETVVVDVTEHEVERPKKNRKHTIVANKRNIHLNPR